MTEPLQEIRWAPGCNKSECDFTSLAYAIFSILGFAWLLVRASIAMPSRAISRAILRNSSGRSLWTAVSCSSAAAARSLATP